MTDEDKREGESGNKAGLITRALIAKSSGITLSNVKA